MTGTPIAADARFSGGYRVYFLLLTALISAFAVIDRIALVTMGQAIKQDLAMSDFQFGMASGFAFALVYAIAGLPLARLADTRNRVRLIAVSVAIWSVFAMLSGSVRSFVQLMLCRVVIGVGEAGVQPPAVAIVSDLYPPARRGSALAMLALGLPLGTLVGAAGAGYLAEAFSWRTVFLMLGVPGVALALLAWATLRDPPRGLSEGAEAAEHAPHDMWGTLRFLFRFRAMRHVVAGLALTYFAAAGIGSFLPQYFARAFQLGMGQAGLMFGIVGATSNVVGIVSGGMIGDWVSKRESRWYAWLPALGIGISAPLYIASFVIPNAVAATGVLVIAGAFLFLHYAPSQALLQNMVAPGMRATAAFVFFFIMSMVGYGVGPSLLGLISDLLAGNAFALGDFSVRCPGGVAAAHAGLDLVQACRVAAAHGIRSAMTIMSGLFFWAALHFWLAARTLPQELADARAKAEI